MARLIVVGAGPAGLGAALFSARRGHSVVLLERDADAPPAEADACFERWNRRGVGQIRQAHGFLALACRVLLEEAPEVFAALSPAGVTAPMPDATPPELPMLLRSNPLTLPRARVMCEGRFNLNGRCGFFI